MSQTMSRREMLLAAGGVTFLGLTWTARGYLFAPTEAAAPDGIPPRPMVYTAAPFIQPGPASKLEDGRDSMVIAWQTENRPAKFNVEFGENGVLNRQAAISRAQPYRSGRQGLVNYAATASGLKLGTRYSYQVKQDGVLVAEGYFTTRKPRGAAMRFVSFGDNSYGDLGQRAVAFHAYKSLPDFVMNTGDNVYGSGLNSEYIKYFFPIYNADDPSASVGAPLLRSVPFYTVIANHDVIGKAPDGGPAADFDRNPDALGYYSVMNLPSNGPSPPQPTPLVGKAALIDHFQKNCPRFPNQANYSFDAGDCHFLCLDSNVYVNPADERWHDFIASDLGSTDAKWKFVVYHHPAFNVGMSHYKQQHMRLLSPKFEKFGVDFVLSGHEHNYQRTMPLRFQPRGVGQGAKVGDGTRFVPGTFTVDRAFDGRTKTKPNGVIYVTTGAGGKTLYGPDIHNDPAKWIHPEDGNVAYCSTVVSDRHSFTTFDVTPEAIVMRQIDQWGQELDSIRVTKA
jgi:acid phosphatase type 7